MEQRRHYYVTAKEVTTSGLLKSTEPARKKARRQERETILAAKIQALPEKLYGVIYADPEWRFEPWSRETGMDRAADNHYPTSPTALIAARDVPSIAAADCVLFLWSTAPMQLAAYRVMAAWGFTYRSQVVWDKEEIGTGFWFRIQHEILLVSGVTRHDPAASLLGSAQRSIC
jgi:N6-adenosine-specific RNA methylase IME4